MLIDAYDAIAGAHKAMKVAKEMAASGTGNGAEVSIGSTLYIIESMDLIAEDSNPALLKALRD